MKHVVILAFWLISHCAFANDNQPLFSACHAMKKDVQSSEAEPCRFFIKGFMAASRLADLPPKVALNEDRSDFFVRAYQTRLGTTRLKTHQRPCESSTNQDLIIYDTAQNMPDKLKQLSELKHVIIQTLKTHQTCVKQTS